MAKKTGSLAVVADRDPWDRQHGESAQAFAAFAHYRDAGSTRSLLNTARYLIEHVPVTSKGTPRSKNEEAVRRAIADWSVKWGWQNRVEAFEIAEDRRRRQERAALVRTMEERHLSAADQLMFVALARARGLTRQDGSVVAALQPEAIDSWGELSAVLERAVRIARVTVGLPTDLTKSLDTFTYSEVLAMIGDVVDFALEDMPAESHERYLQRVRDRLNQPRRS